MKRTIILSFLALVTLIGTVYAGVAKLNEINDNYKTAIDGLNRKNKSLEDRNSKLEALINYTNSNYSVAKSDVEKQVGYSVQVKAAFDQLSQNYESLKHEYNDLKIQDQVKIDQLSADNKDLFQANKKTLSKINELSIMLKKSFVKNESDSNSIKTQVSKIQPICPSPVVRVVEIPMNRMPASHPTHRPKKKKPVDHFN